jgi:hypothetical protein
VLARYLSPTADCPIELEVGSVDALDDALAAAASTPSDRGVPAVELAGAEGSTLVFAQTLMGAVLLWIDSLGRSFHSLGSANSAQKAAVFDYFGSYTEVPPEFVVPFELGRAAALAYLAGEHPSKAGLALEPD